MSAVDQLERVASRVGARPRVHAPSVSPKCLTLQWLALSVIFITGRVSGWAPSGMSPPMERQ